jgi:hypothetical protein
MAEVRSQFIAALVVLIVGAGCASGRYGPSANTRSSPAPRAIDRLTVDERRTVLRRAHVWRPIDTRSLNILAGPRANDAFTHDQLVPCDYDYPDKPLTGMSPKFECAVSRDDIVKVKYGPDNGEVYAEVAATRLFWALGFAADRMYPVRVICRKCPADPFKESKAEWHLGKTTLVSDQTFNPATIERPLAGEEVEVPGYEGWAWPELEYVSEETGGAPRSHIDALELLAVFIQHVDSKPEQQAIKCAPQNIRRDRSGNATCSAPLLVVKDLGSSFGAARRFNFKKMDLASWREVPIWRDPAACTGHLTRSIIGSLSNPPISEAGRQFLADRLMLLTDRQIRDLFVAARVEQRGETIRDANGDTRPVTADDWVEAFKEKRAQIVDHRCPA